MTGLKKALRAIAGIAVIVVLLVVVNSWMGQYRIASQRAAREASATVPAASAEPSPTPVQQADPIMVARDVQLRTAPDNGAKVVRMLKTGEKLTVLSTQLPWLQVQDMGGRTGYVLNDDHVKSAR